MMRYQYWGFGLNIDSEIEFPELLPSTFNKTDVVVSIGATPSILVGENVIHKVRMSASPTEYLLDVLNVARYYATDGNKIIIEPYSKADKHSIRLFMLSNAMAAILHQQKKIPFHASGIITDNGLVLFTGNSGAGKSTTACGLIELGYKLFTDDVCVLNLNKETGKVEATPSYPMMKLWNNTINQINYNKTDAHQLRPHIEKYGFHQHDHFSTASLRVVQVIVLKKDDSAAQYHSTPLNTLAAFNELQQNTYRRSHVDMMNLREEHFRMISSLTQQAKVIEIRRPENHNNIPDFISYIHLLINTNAPA